MSAVERRTRVGRPWRRLKRWARHTPSGEIAFALVSAGVALIFIALMLAFVVF